MLAWLSKLLIAWDEARVAERERLIAEIARLEPELMRELIQRAQHTRDKLIMHSGPGPISIGRRIDALAARVKVLEDERLWRH